MFVLNFVHHGESCHFSSLMHEMELRHAQERCYPYGFLKSFAMNYFSYLWFVYVNYNVVILFIKYVILKMLQHKSISRSRLLELFTEKKFSVC